ncbi:MAG: ribonucleotide-diphosphate reductase subunit beta [Acidobacteriia bacterium]|nr:ribonucleotide-diphosphate reductase subunit beta [Terriglobia bacterium]
MSAEARVTKSPRELYSMAKTLGTWDPEKIAVAEDKPHWEFLNADQREQLIKVCALFYEGEVSVSDTLAWFMLAVPEADRRMFLSSQIYEEVKHAEFFELYFQKVCGKVDTASYLSPEYKGVLLDELRQRGENMGRTLTGRNGDLGLELALFAAHYMGIIEGVMAVGGYDFFEELLSKTGMFPRLLEGIRMIRADEGRHIVHGMDYLREMLAKNPQYAGPVRELFMNEAAKIPARTDFVFSTNAFNLDRTRLQAMAFEHHQQRMREAGL